MAARIKKGDLVQVIAGKDKGEKGRVLQVVRADLLLVEGVNRAKRHQSPRRFREAGIVEKEMPIHVSNVAVFNPVTGKGDRIGVRSLEDGRKVRFFKSTGEVVDI